MADKPVLQWIAVNGLTDDVFREGVVTDALNHLPSASADLRKYALGT